MSPVPLVRVALLDGFRVELVRAGECRSPDLPRAVQRLVAHLSLYGRPTRTAVAGLLWPDACEDKAQGSLRSALWRVRKAAPGLVVVSGETLSLHPDVRVDVAELTQWARRALDPSVDLDDLATEEPALAGELLPGWYEDWVLLERERLRQLRVHALEALSEKLAASARYGEAVQAAYAAVRSEPLRESAHRTVVRVHLAEGNLAEAMRAYEAFRTMLADELGVLPTRQMRELIHPVTGPAESVVEARTSRTTPPRRPAASSSGPPSTGSAFVPGPRPEETGRGGGVDRSRQRPAGNGGGNTRDVRHDEGAHPPGTSAGVRPRATGPPGAALAKAVPPARLHPSRMATR